MSRNSCADEIGENYAEITITPWIAPYGCGTLPLTLTLATLTHDGIVKFSSNADVGLPNNSAYQEAQLSQISRERLFVWLKIFLVSLPKLLKIVQGHSKLHWSGRV